MRDTPRHIYTFILLIGVLSMLIFGFSLPMSGGHSGGCLPIFTRSGACPPLSTSLHALFHIEALRQLSLGIIALPILILLILFSVFVSSILFLKTKEDFFGNQLFVLAKNAKNISPRHKILRWISLHEKRDPHSR